MRGMAPLKATTAPAQESKRDMSLNRVISFGSSGQATAVARAPVRLSAGRPPQLDIAWGSFHQGIGSSLGVLFRKSPVPKKLSIDGFFKYCWIEGKLPRRALVAAALWHIVFFVMPFPQFPARAHHNSSFDNVELSWSGPINDLPLLDMQAPKPKPKPSPRGEPEKPVPPEGADAFHPRQHIFSDPVHPNHPRQTLINSAAPPEPPKILPNLPNIVQIQELPGPARPRLEISKEALAKLHPKQRRVATVTDAPPPDVPVFEQKPGELAMIASPNAPARPKLELNAGAAPRIAQKAQAGDAGPAPEVGATELAGANGNTATLIALSATPAPPAPVAPPQGNLAARVSISPEGKQPGGSPKGVAAENGAAGGAGRAGGSGAGNGAGINGMDVSIRGGNPPANKGMSGPAGAAKISAPAPHTLVTRPEPHAAAEDEPARTAPPNFTALPPGAKPEQIFASKRIYKMHIDMPNLNSATGSWILNFTELRVDSDNSHVTPSDLSGPTPIRKVDPKYPPTLMNEHVEGEVVLYAVIRRDGSVDSIQVVRGVDEELDKNAMNALSQWKFRPAMRQGEPVELEAIVHIPFHAPDLR